MSVKIEIDSTEGLDESVAKLYTKQDNGKYRLDVEGVEDVTGLKTKRDELLAENVLLKRKTREAEEAAEAERLRKLQESGNVEALRADYEGRIQTLTSTKDAELQQARGQLHDLTVNATATDLAAKLAVPGSAEVLLPHIKQRLVLEQADGHPIVRVLGKDGKPSAASLADLEKEIAETAAFAPLISASRGSGAGGTGGTGGKAAKTWNELTGMERVELRRTNPAEHARLKAAAGA